MTIYYYRTNVYGNETMYVKDKRQAEVVTGLTGRKTLSKSDIIFLNELGIKFMETLKPAKTK